MKFELPDALTSEHAPIGDKIMSENKDVPEGTYKLSSIEVNTVSESIGEKIKVSLDNGREFFGTLEKYDDHWLHLKTMYGKPLMLKRRKISSLVVV